MPKSKKMPKHGKAFARAYVCKCSRNATAAARTLPGVSEKSAAETGSRLLMNLEVLAEIARLEKQLDEKTVEITKERILKELAIIGFADLKDYVEVLEGGIVHLKPWSELPEGATRAVKVVKEHKTIRADGEGDGDGIVVDNHVEFSHHDKLGALKEMAKLKGLYPEEGTGEAKNIVYVFGKE